jgi:hypothetical protein
MLEKNNLASLQGKLAQAVFQQNGILAETLG